MTCKLDKSFYLDEDVVALSRSLLGKYLVTKIDGLTSGMIVETEAYKGAEDRACHAYANLRTARTAPLFEEGGISYIYLCYGLHHLFNVVTAPKEVPHAILIRAIEPVEGVEIMLKRRKMLSPSYKLTSGPGSMSQALGLSVLHNQTDLTKDLIWIEDRGVKISEESIISTTRVGVEYAKEDALLPWRFIIRGNPWVSGYRKGKI